jgi:hypothetical protein
MVEMRDASWPSPREGYGTWNLCLVCGHEWPQPPVDPGWMRVLRDSKTG